MGTVTFLIGNGFDLNLGLKTGYEDIYKGYIGTPSHSIVISSFKEELKRDFFREVHQWSDFEKAMGEYAAQFQTEQEFIGCVRDFKAYMVRYLEAEDKRFESRCGDQYIGNAYRQGFVEDCSSFANRLMPNSGQAIYSSLKTNEPSQQIITFNYTLSIEHILGTFSSLTYDRVHIHGELYKDIILGVDDESQLCHSFALSQSGRRSFIKPIVNDEYDRVRVQTAMTMIDNSDVICVYGMSLGVTDMTWARRIAQWLKASDSHQLVYHFYDQKQYPRYNNDEMLDAQDKYREEVLKKLSLSSLPEVEAEKITQQIHIPVGQNLFGELSEAENKATSRTQVRSDNNITRMAFPAPLV